MDGQSEHVNIHLFTIGRGDYTYRPLSHPQEIRLLELLPGRDQQPLHCNIVHADLNAFPRYEALSYAWGDELNCGNILIGDKGSAIRARRNCIHALTRIRDTGDVRVLWVDALCINQRNVRERNHQVQLMRAIYSSAQTVLIYPGPSSQDDSDAMSRLARFSEYTQDFLSSGHISYEWRKGAPRSVEPLLAAILEQPWFSRTWVVQEVMLAKSATVVLGDGRGVPWKQFAQMVAVTLRGNSFKLWVPDVIKLMLGIGSGASDRSLLQLVGATTTLHASDPRDKIIGLLGIASDAHHYADLADYTLDAEELYARFAWTTIRVRGDLDVLASCCGNPEWPRTWVPRWSEPWQPRPFPFRDIVDVDRSPADEMLGRSPPGPPARLSRGQLVVRGAVVDRVAKGASATPFHHVRQLLPALDGDTMCNLNFHRQLFLTESGLLGFGPGRLRKRDVVCIIAGSAMPLLLRPTTQRGGMEDGNNYDDDDGDCDAEDEDSEDVDDALAPSSSLMSYRHYSTSARPPRRQSTYKLIGECFCPEMHMKNVSGRELNTFTLL